MGSTIAFSDLLLSQSAEPLLSSAFAMAQPMREERVLLFLDLVGSTSLAESMRLASKALLTRKTARLRELRVARRNSTRAPDAYCS